MNQCNTILCVGVFRRTSPGNASFMLANDKWPKTAVAHTDTNETVLSILRCVSLNSLGEYLRELQHSICVLPNPFSCEMKYNMFKPIFPLGLPLDRKNRPKLLSEMILASYIGLHHCPCSVDNPYFVSTPDCPVD